MNPSPQNKSPMDQCSTVTRSGLAVLGLNLYPTTYSFLKINMSGKCERSPAVIPLGHTLQCQTEDKHFMHNLPVGILQGANLWFKPERASCRVAFKPSLSECEEEKSIWQQQYA